MYTTLRSRNIKLSFGEFFLSRILRDATLPSYILVKESESSAQDNVRTSGLGQKYCCLMKECRIVLFRRMALEYHASFV